ncbi:hypothetical protein BDW59DRAFT_142726 [Aspergillus cavernicola]|uniref:Uncharacterized protein n=1 Tax=Aspergillus cavernicola TaxID=176166 RepID=A0ABR4IMV7_9EURO
MEDEDRSTSISPLVSLWAIATGISLLISNLKRWIGCTMYSVQASHSGSEGDHDCSPEDEPWFWVCRQQDFS